MKILNYPVPYDQPWATSLLSADQKVVYPIFYFLLSRLISRWLSYLINSLPELEKRAYLAKFLVPLFIPEEFLVDNEIKTILD